MVNLGRLGGVNAAENCGHQQPNITSIANCRHVLFHWVYSRVFFFLLVIFYLNLLQSRTHIYFDTVYWESNCTIKCIMVGDL